jgi:hypothetical protein
MKSVVGKTISADKIVKPEIFWDWGYADILVYKDFNGFFTIESILRKKAKFTIPFQFISEILAVFETHDNTMWLDRTFIYNGSTLVLSRDEYETRIFPKAKKTSSSLDNDNAIELSEWLYTELVQIKR